MSNYGVFLSLRISSADQGSASTVHKYAFVEPRGVA